MRSTLALGVVALAASWIGGMWFALRASGALPRLGAEPLTAARDLVRAGRISDALNEYRSAWAIDPSSANGLDEMVALMERSGAKEAAVRAREEALARRPVDPRRHAALAAALSGVGRFDAALKHLELALKLDPGFAPALVGMGDVFWERGDPRRAAAAYARALALDPGSADAHNKMGVALAVLGDQEGAVAQFSAALRILPTSAEIASNLDRARAAGAER
ncbi:MAG TPA: tetratricopeptide repeat protein [Vicinamibacteria bacterium]|nr:tetratricopeptide repeat protein [Vicinamibacteria bacterium]